MAIKCWGPIAAVYHFFLDVTVKPIIDLEKSNGQDANVQSRQTKLQPLQAALHSNTVSVGDKDSLVSLYLSETLETLFRDQA